MPDKQYYLPLTNMSLDEAKQQVCEALRGHNKELVRKALKEYKRIRYAEEKQLEEQVATARQIFRAPMVEHNFQSNLI